MPYLGPAMDFALPGPPRAAVPFDPADPEAGLDQRIDVVGQGAWEIASTSKGSTDLRVRAFAEPPALDKRGSLVEIAAHLKPERASCSSRIHRIAGVTKHGCSR